MNDSFERMDDSFKRIIESLDRISAVSVASDPGLHVSLADLPPLGIGTVVSQA